MNLDIHAAVVMAVILTILGALLSVWSGFRAIRKGQKVAYYRLSRRQVAAGWWAIVFAVTLVGFAFLLGLFGEPVSYRFFPPSPSPSPTPSPSPSPKPSPTPAAGPKYGGILRTWSTVTPPNFDNQRKPSYGPLLGGPVFNNLVQFNLAKPEASPDNIIGDLATKWDVSADGSFSIEADVSHLLKQGNGVYTVVVWAKVANESMNLTNYSIFVR